MTTDNHAFDEGQLFIEMEIQAMGDEGAEAEVIEVADIDKIDAIATLARTMENVSEATLIMARLIDTAVVNPRD